MLAIFTYQNNAGLNQVKISSESHVIGIESCKKAR